VRQAPPAGIRPLPIKGATGHRDRMAAAARNPHAIMFTWQQRAAYEQLRGLLMAGAIPDLH
jgi:hypothetical protein